MTWKEISPNHHVYTNDQGHVLRGVYLQGNWWHAYVCARRKVKRGNFYVEIDAVIRESAAPDIRQALMEAAGVVQSEYRRAKGA